MKLVIRDRAAADIENIHAWIARDRPRTANAVVERLTARIRNLLLPGMSRIGRPGREPGTRELIQPPYVIVYKVDEAAEEITVLAVFHGRQDR